MPIFRKGRGREGGGLRNVFGCLHSSRRIVEEKEEEEEEL